MQVTERFTADAPGGLDPDALFDALSDSRRRHLISYLDGRDAPIALADAAAAVVSRESDSSSGRPPADEIESAYVSLYHVHVPKLADAGVVEYDRERNTVALAVDADEVRKVAELPDADGPR